MYRELALSAFGDNGMNQRDSLLETKDLFSVFTAPYIDQNAVIRHQYHPFHASLGMPSRLLSQVELLG